MYPEPFKLERFFARHEFRARYLLSSSDCEGLAMAGLVAGADAEMQARWHNLRLGYTESQGLPELRAEIASTYEEVDADEVLTAAPEELIFLTMNALLNPGDHVICTFPGYQSLYEIARAIGCPVSLWRPEEQDAAWVFDPAELERLLCDDTKLVVINFPHNPTGALPATHDFEQMLDAIRESGAWLLSDEMYRGVEPAEDLRLPAAVDRYEKALSLSGVSKAYALAGLRIGWAATHDTVLLQRMKQLKDYTTICSSAPSELLALMGLRARDGILAANRRLIARNAALADEFFRRHADRFGWVRPQAGTVCFPYLRQASVEGGTEGAEAFCSRVLRDTGILLLPSTVFDFGDRHFRLGLGRQDFETELSALDDYLSL